MSEWLAVAPALAMTVVLLWAPGSLIGWALGLRGYLLAGAAPAMTVAVLAMAAIAAPFAGLDYSVPVWGTAVVVVAAAGAVVRLVTRPTRPPRSSRRRSLDLITVAATAPAVLFTASFQSRRMMRAIGEPGHVSQTYDANYHLNAVMLMQETRDASSLHMTLATPGRQSGFYPAAWHDVVLTITDLTGLGVPSATNVLTLVVSSLVWPLAVVALARVLFGSRPLPLALVALLSTAFPQLPNELVIFGVLYPNLLAYVFVPVAVALVVVVLGRRGRLAAAVALLLVTIAIGLAQPNGAFLLAFVGVPILGHRLAHWAVPTWRRGTRARAGATGAVACFVGGLVLLWASLDLVAPIAALRDGNSWVPTMTARDALWETLTLAVGHPDGEPQLLLAAAVAVGFVLSMRVPRWRWLATSYGVLVILCVIALAGVEPHRSEWTGFWYTDPERLAAALPVLAVPLAALAAWRAVQRLWSWVRSREGLWWRAAHRVGPVAVTVAVSAAVVLVHGWQTPTRLSFAEMHDQYHPDPISVGSDELVSAEEYALLARLDEIVPDGVAVAGNPWDGSAMSWAIGGREAVFPHTSLVPDPDRVTVASRLHEAGQDPAVCDAVRNLDLGYVLRMGRPLWGYPADPRVRDYPGIARAEDAAVLEPVLEVGDARLLRITACD